MATITLRRRAPMYREYQMIETTDMRAELLAVIERAQALLAQLDREGR